MMAALVFQAAGLSVSFVVCPATGHAVALVQLVQQHVAALFLFDVIIDPHFILRHKLIYVVVTAGSEVDVKHAAHQAAIHNPHAKAVLQLLPQPLMHLLAIGQLPSVVSQAAQVSGTATLLALLAVSHGQCLVIGYSSGHKPVLHQR